jgi:hypothetical protein
LAAALKLELKGELEIDNFFEFSDASDSQIIDRWNVIDVMRDLDDNGFMRAVMTPDADALKELKAKAIEKIVADTDLMRMAAWEFKQTEVTA